VYAYQALRHAGILLQPVIPGKAAELLDRLGIPDSERTLEALNWSPGEVDVGMIRERLETNKGGPLFAPIKKTGDKKRTA
jgi:methionyl-tRNA synthetase